MIPREAPLTHARRRCVPPLPRLKFERFVVSSGTPGLHCNMIIARSTRATVRTVGDLMVWIEYVHVNVRYLRAWLDITHRATACCFRDTPYCTHGAECFVEQTHRMLLNLLVPSAS